MPTVLLATDGSDFAVAAARRGLPLLPPDSEVTAITVVPRMPPVRGMSGPAIDSGLVYPRTGEEQDATVAQGRADVDATVDALGIEAAVRVEQGDPGETICEVAARERFELVLVGSHGAGFLKRALLGSVSRHVLQHAPCPVLVVRGPEPDEPT